MAATGKTTNYELGLYRPLDTMAPLVTENNNMTIIDRQMKLNETAASTNAALIESVQEDVTELQNQFQTVQTRMLNITCNQYAGSSMRTLQCLIIGHFTFYRMYGQVSLHSAIKQTIGNTTYLQLCSFPEAIPNITATSPDTGNSIAAVSAFMFSGSNFIIRPLFIIGYRAQNVTYIALRTSESELANVTSIQCPLMQFDD